MCLTPEDWDYEDAINEAILLILSGKQPWDGLKGFEDHLLKVIRSVVQEWHVTPAPDYRNSATGADPERQLVAREAWEQIQNLFRYDEPYNSILQLLAEGMSVAEISKYLQRSEGDIHRLIHDIRVRLQRALPDLHSLAVHLTSV
jgi:DNA-directed RNA polymerase specialized sigma24 family protein